ncbi:solute carrier organic anion transporter family member 5A1-like [Amphiura filiformis]|uniref:solute carrier organic anion transporter family member 5A1-like n=1 Tax=Amphiura filiformis TaxID=82378 RepID=UPI003B21CD66
MGVKHSAKVNRQQLDSKDLSGNLSHSETLCSCGPCKPSWLQILANPKLFTFNAVLILAAKVACFSYVGGILATLERRFQLSSSESGTLVIINDVAELSIAIIVSYFGHTGHRPRWIAVGTIIMGIGTLLSALPHFLTNPLDPNAVISGSFGNRIPTNNNFGICQTDGYDSLPNATIVTDIRNGSANGQCTEEGSRGLGLVKWLIAGQILAGLGAASFYPLIISYLDDSVGKTQLTSYTAALFVAMALGATCGYIMSSQTTSLYVDFDRIPIHDIPDIPHYDPRWIGAWWLGFIVAGIVMIVCALPMFLFPKKMPKPSGVNSATCKEEQQLENNTESHDNTLTTKSEGNKSGLRGKANSLLGIVKALKRLLNNIPLMFICLATSCETATFAIMGAFGIKTLQVQFTISSALASIIFGGLLIPLNIGSQVLSAYIIRRLKLGLRGCARMVLICMIIGGIIYPLLMFVGCQNFNIAGVNADYSASLTQIIDDTQQRNVIHSCNFNCGCNEGVFRPVCGSDGTTYISPCHAGCQLNISGNTPEDTIYADCKCIVNQTTTDTFESGTAASGLCLDCGMWIFSISVLLFMPLIFVMYLVANPIIYITMRVVDEEDRSVAIAVKNVFTKCLGYFPAPVLFGIIINSTCIYWQQSCGNRGSCWMYDIVKYRYAYYGAISALRCCTIFCYIIVNKLIQPEQSEIQNYDHVEETKEVQTLPTDCSNDKGMESQTML